MWMLSGKKVLVTGASRGIGRAIAEKFASEGAVVFAGVRNNQDMGNFSKGYLESGGQIIPVVLDVCDKTSIRQCIMKIKKEVGILDVLVNNAGITIIERMEMADDEAIRQVYDTNVFGLIHVSQMAIRLLKKSPAASMINISSVLWDRGDIGQTVYASSKAAVSSMTKTWAKEFAAKGIRVNAIAPGNTNTDMFNVIDDESRGEAISLIGLGRVAEPDDIANVALFLASDMSSYVTGEIIGVNGGIAL